MARLKIDRSFICAILSDSNYQAITRSVIAMAVSMNHQVTAEGVELIKRLQFLYVDQCNDDQGFHKSRPMNVANAERYPRPLLDRRQDAA